MKFRALKFLLAILGSLAVLTIIYIGIGRRPKTRNPFAKVDFTRIEIKAKGEVCTFIKKEAEWKLVKSVEEAVDSSGEVVSVSEYLVDTTAFNRLIQGLKDLELGEVVSTREARHHDFEVDEKGIELKVYWDSHSMSVILGKLAADFIHSYIRFPDKNETYLARGLTKNIVDRKIDDWRDKTIFSFNPAEVNELIVGDKKVVRADTGWIMEDKEVRPQVVEENKVRQVLNILASLRADGFGTENFEPSLEVKISLPIEELVLYIGEKIDNKYPAKVKDNPTIFILNSWKVDRIRNIL